jgi:signal transduction histidine kinase
MATPNIPLKRYRLGLVTQLIILVVVVTMVIGGTIGIVLTNTSANNLKQDILQNNLVHADLAAQFASSYLKAVQAHIEVFAQRPDIRQAVLNESFEELQPVLAQLVQIQTALDSTGFYDSNGIQMASSIADATTVGQSFSDREWFQQAVATRQPYLGIPLKSRVTGKAVVPYAIPILDDQGQLRGVLAAGISLSALSDAIVNINYGEGTRASIIDTRNGGIILAHIDPTRILTPISGKNEAATRLLAGERGIIETRSSSGEMDLIGFTTVPDLPWGIMIITPRNTALAIVDSLRVQSILIILLGIFVVGLLGSLLMLRVTRPLTQLRDAARKLAAGESGYRVRLNQNNEIGELGREFNRMADALSEKERQLHNRAVQLEQSNKELEAFAYSVSHDLRAPLRSIDGFSQVLLEDYNDKLDASGKNYLQRVRAAAQRMGELIDDLLVLSRVTRYEMKHEKVDLSALAREVTDELQKAQPERKVTSIIAGSLTANGDTNLLRIATTNLLDNAWKFTGKHPDARIEFGAIQKDGETVYFVRDDGVGFDMKYADKLFTPFQRLHTASEFPGTGIGLAIVQRIVHRHGGKIWVESKIEKGTTVYFTLG